MSTPTDREILEHLTTAEPWTRKADWANDLTVLAPFAERMLEAVQLLERANLLLDDPPVWEIGEWLEHYNKNPSGPTLK